MTTKEMADSIYPEVEALLVASQRGSADDTKPSHLYSDAVVSARDRLCETVMQLGRDHPTTLDIDRARTLLRLSNRPLFLTGVHKSGTTLLRNLCDGHSQLAVFPMDGGLSHTRIARDLKADPVPTERDIILRFLRTTLLPLSPVSGRRSWVMGSATGDVVPYIELARTYFALARQQEISVASLLRAMAGSYGALHFGKDIPDQAYWVYKSTLNIDEAMDLAGTFEHARFLHIIRHPCAVYASQKKRQPTKGRLLDPAYELTSMRKGMTTGLRNQERLGASRYHILRYCDLVDKPQMTMKKMAAFADIRDESILCEPTDGGVPATPNTGYKDKHTKRGKVSSHTLAAWVDELHPKEQRTLKVYLGPLMDLYGYSPPPMKAEGTLQTIWELRSFYRGQEGVKALRRRDVLSLWLRRPSRVAI